MDLWPALLVCASGSGMCEDGFAGDDAPRAVCPSIDDNREMPGTTDQKDGNEGAEGAGSLCVRLQGTGVSTGGRAHSSRGGARRPSAMCAQGRIGGEVVA